MNIDQSLLKFSDYHFIVLHHYLPSFRVIVADYSVSIVHVRTKKGVLAKFLGFLVAKIMMRTMVLRSPIKYDTRIWEEGLRERVSKLFNDLAYTDSKGGSAYLPPAKLVSLLYELRIVRKEEWTTSAILEEMNLRGYGNDVTVKPSYGAQRPQPLGRDECFKWIAHFRTLSLLRR
jgi:hypothetical protein